MSQDVFMAIARKYLVDAEVAMYYHITSRCVQGAWLMGTDPRDGRNYDHRKDWVVEQLERITPAFSVNVQTYAVMSNHFHLVVYYDPLAALSWDNEEVARRWFIAHPAQLADPEDDACRAEAIELLASDPERVAHCRGQLGSLSEFMKTLKQGIALRANRESDIDGHFWAQRFYSGAILSEKALLTTMAYVDLNPIRAKIAHHIEACEHTGLAARLRHAELDGAQLEQYLSASLEGLGQEAPVIAYTLKRYRKFVEELGQLEIVAKQLLLPKRHQEAMTREESWQIGKQVLGSKPRAIGGKSQILDWLKARGFSPREQYLPGHLS